MGLPAAHRRISIPPATTSMASAEPMECFCARHGKSPNRHRCGGLGHQCFDIVWAAEGKCQPSNVCSLFPIQICQSHPRIPGTDALCHHHQSRRAQQQSLGGRAQCRRLCRFVDEISQFPSQLRYRGDIFFGATDSGIDARHFGG